jgi:acetoin:2,6-dichlorophenolindophenol oxidoreductase subunit alpha
MAKIINSKPARKAKPSPEAETFSLVSNEKLLAIYSAMIKCRMLEQRATALFQQGKLASDLHASSGREAASAAISIDLQPNDALSIAPGDWLPAFVKGLPLEKLLRILASPSAQPNGQRTTAASDPELKNTLAVDEARRPTSVREHAVAAQAAKNGTIVAAVLPSAEESLQPWHSLLAEAASKRLPIVFVHHASIAHHAAGAHHIATANRPSESPANRKRNNPDALFHGVPAIGVDAYDAVAVYRVAYEAIIRARQGRGATLLECLAHSGTLAETSENEGDPISFMENYLKRKGIEPEQDRQQIVTAFNRDLELATRFLDQ